MDANYGKKYGPKAGFDGGYIGGYGHHGGFGHHGGIGHHGGFGRHGGIGHHGGFGHHGGIGHHGGYGHGCAPKVYKKHEDGYLVADFQEAGRAKTIGAESTCFERVRDDYKRGGERKDWC